MMDTLRVAIVDDEESARLRILRLLEGDPEIRVVAECSDGAEAVAAIPETRPHLVFLDVEMPDMDGFEVLRRVEPTERPVVVFVTEHDHYALQAFEVRAVDYLRKPYDDQRFFRALGRARARVVESGVRAVREEMEELLQNLEGRRNGAARSGKPQPILVRSAARTVFLDMNELNWVEAEGNYVRLHTDDRTYLMRDSMTSFMERLASDRFIRVHRSAIVRRGFIREIRRTRGGGHLLVLRDGTGVAMSRSGRQRLESVLGRVI